MALNKKLSDALQFANWCKREKLDPHAGAELIALAHKAHAAGERACNAAGKRDAHVRAMERFEQFAASLGLVTDWPGLWPHCERRNSKVRVDIPAI